MPLRSRREGDHTTRATIETPAELSAVFESAGPSVIFLHDPWCPISSDADDEMRALGRAYHEIDVSQHRELSRAVQTLTGIRHESPQVIVLRNGRPVWNASHRKITREAVAAAAASAAKPD